jgi:hypothetical protein
MVKTTPPGRGSRLLRPGGSDPVHDLAVGTPCGAMLLATGPFSDDDLGVTCYHSKTGAVELYLNHLVDGPAEYVVVGCTAGADSFASGLFTRFDLTVLVAEPTRKGISVYRQWPRAARTRHGRSVTMPGLGSGRRIRDSPAKIGALPAGITDCVDRFRRTQSRHREVRCRLGRYTTDAGGRMVRPPARSRRGG